ncbi:exopolyphosphatase [Cryomorphaceae bacterium]|nr:exopolyphosphatase [Cryomorphaceae bacterium]
MSLKYKRIAGIDIGSNAIRLLICNVIDTKEGPVFKKSSLIRVPIRLGADVFTKGKIGKRNVKRLIHAMKAFKHLMLVNDVVDYKACATSAMREADNGTAVIAKLAKESGIHINIISGKEEADIIYSTHIEQLLNRKRTYLYVDVGGGSTELTYFSGQDKVASRSFNIGTIRILTDRVKPKHWKEMSSWVSDHAKAFDKVEIIGSGGNINKLFKMSGQRLGKPIDLRYLNESLSHLEGLTLEERVLKLDLNVDRADVIVPASQIFVTVMEACDAKRVHVPKIGLADGIVRTIYNERFLKPSYA